MRSDDYDHNGRVRYFEEKHWLSCLNENCEKFCCVYRRESEWKMRKLEAQLACAVGALRRVRNQAAVSNGEETKLSHIWVRAECDAALEALKRIEGVGK
jgi:hypothetical protein